MTSVLSWGVVLGFGLPLGWMLGVQAYRGLRGRDPFRPLRRDQMDGERR